MGFYNEYKYAVLQNQLDHVKRLLTTFYGDSDEFSSGIVDSIYYDDLYNGAYHMCLNGESQKRKIRIRGYGEQFNQIHVKDKDIFGVKKLKAKIVPCSNINGIPPTYNSLKPLVLGDPAFSQIDSYARNLVELQPVIRVRYHRYRFRILDYRFTLDTNVEIIGLSPNLGIIGSYGLLDHHVLEVKTEQPRPYIPLLGLMKLPQISFSKFYLGIAMLVENS